MMCAIIAYVIRHNREAAMSSLPEALFFLDLQDPALEIVDGESRCIRLSPLEALKLYLYLLDREGEINELVSLMQQGQALRAPLSLLAFSPRTPLLIA